MSTISRVDQAILLLKDRLRRLEEQSPGATRKSGTTRADQSETLLPLRQLVQQSGVSEEEIRRTLVRALLADALGDELVGSLEFQSVAEQVACIIEESETGRALLTQALAEQGAIATKRSRKP